MSERLKIPDRKYDSDSAAIISRLQSQDEFKRARRIHSYVSMNDRKEVDTHPLLKDVIGSEKELVVPRINRSKNELDHVLVDNLGILVRNNWGVLEPRNGTEVAVSTIDLVIVPMVGGDEARNRIGYGKGFYDRFLALVSCPTVGLAFERCITKKIPVEPFDIPLTKIITEQRVIQE